ncbi:MAG TPA: anti-sigma factor [Propionibacteriaceae bacterium]|nr:anti-sigma factor [Propionibacteriaceae bacterium]
MTHLSSDRLAGGVLGTEEAFTEAEQNHLASCAQCSEEFAELGRIADLTRQPEHVDPQLVPNAVWQSVQAQLGISTAAAATTTSAAGTAITATAESTPPTTLTQRPDRTFRKRRSLLIAALAAAFGLIVGAGITTVATRDRVEVTSRVSLEALPGHTGHGTAELVTDQGQPELRVQIDAPTTPDRYREVWLINTDGERMYTLGVLPEDGRASYPLPPELAGQLQGFTIVDVSIEPYDGNPAHSRDSQVRGVLPT